MIGRDLERHRHLIVHDDSPAGIRQLHQFLLSMVGLIFQSVTIGIAIVAIMLTVVNVFL